MRAVVAFESMFGNTRLVADAIADGLRDHYDVSVVPVGSVDRRALGGFDLVVLGAPTHMHGLSRPASRNAAKEQAAKSHGTIVFEPGADRTGMRECIAELAGLHCKAAAFDTRLGGPGFLTGRASRRIGRGLSRCGAQVVVPPESFIVDKRNVLKPGELDRARAWAARLAVVADSESRYAVA